MKLKALIFYLVGILFSFAAQGNTCPDLFLSSTELVPQTALLPLEDFKIDSLFTYNIPQSRYEDHTLFSRDKRWVAYSRKKESTIQVVVVDLKNKKQIFENLEFTSLRSLHFGVDGELWVEGTFASDGRVAKPYVFNFLSEEPLPLAPPAKRSEHVPSNSLMLWSPFWWFATLPADSKKVNDKYLDLPGSPYHGTGVKQLIELPDQNFMIAIQDSANSLKTVPYVPSFPGAYPFTSLKNIGAYVFNKKTLKVETHLSYEGLVPDQAWLGPEAKHIAFKLESPLAANKPRQTIVIVDSHDLQKVLFSFEFDKPGHDVALGATAYKTIANQINVSWSPSGDKILISENVSGSLILVDVNTGESSQVLLDYDHRQPLLGAEFFEDGSLLAIRYYPARDGLAAGLVGQKIEVSDVKNFKTNLNQSEMQPLFQQAILFSSKFFRWGLHQTPKFLGLHSMKNGKRWVLALESHLILMDSQNPKNTTLLSPNDSESDRLANAILEVKKLSEDRLLITDRQTGVFEITLPGQIND